ncbi:MAG: hypothetical protein CMK07_15515 [Ponticaulis sp.]|nr:hypothetical protein [Ponticaulis sp.]
MLRISILETINWPGADLTGKRKLTGDDRFGFDETIGTAWVMDGATDLGPFRIFETDESDAAWIAQALTDALMFSPPAPDEDITPYFSRVLKDVRDKAEQASRVEIDAAPKSVWPIASGMWMRFRDGKTEFAWLGDCVALILPPEAPLEILTKHDQSDLETRTSRELNAMAPEDRLEGLRKIRETQNTEPDHALFGLSPHAVDNLEIAVRDLPVGTTVFLMSDGLWRVVDPYQMMTADEMMTTVLDYGLVPLMRQMRAFENGDDQDASTRIKKTDDASGVLLRVIET